MNPAKSELGQQYWSIFETASDGMLIIDLETGKVLAANPAAAEMHGLTREAFTGLPLDGFVNAKSLPSFANFAHMIKKGKTFELLVQHARRDDSLINVEWRATALDYQDRPCALALLRDVSKRVFAEHELQQRIEARTREQSTLLETSHTLASTLELQPGMILDQLRGIIEYTHAGLFGLTDSTLTALALRGSQQLEKAAPLQIHLEGPEVLAALFNGHRPIRITDVNSSDPSADFLRSLLKEDAALLLEGVQSWMWVPLAVKGRIIGGLGIAHVSRNYFTVHHAALALSIADQVAITMINAELYQNAQAFAVLQERQRLAQNLHDAVNQSLFSAGLIAEVLPRLWDRNQAAARQSLEELRRLTRGALAEMRELLAELRPSVLTDSSLGDLIRQLANAFTGRTNIPVNVTIAGEHVLPAEIQVAFYRICQEALNNIAKHAAAHCVEIDLQYGTGAAKAPSTNARPGIPQEVEVCPVEMSIRDDGHGFDSSGPTAPGHYGLGMMGERAEAVGALLTITSQLRQGTEVTLRWPGIQKQEAR